MLKKITQARLILAACTLLGMAMCGLWIFLSASLVITDVMRKCIIVSLILCTYGMFVLWIRAIYRGKVLPITIAANTENQTSVTIIYASQTGYAELLAQQTAHSLQQGGVQITLLDIAQCEVQHLQQAHRILFIVSTTGEGDAPDSAAQFTRLVMSQALSLKHLQCAVLALGDSHYQQFCAFGRQLNHWLHQQHAQSSFDIVEVDNGDEGALRHWQHQLRLISGNSTLVDWSAPAYQPWKLIERRLLNPNSVGQPVFYIALSPPKNSDASYAWQAGDIVEVCPHSPQQSLQQENLPHREYSIASIMQDGRIDLIVRQVLKDDGSFGIGSGWLTRHTNLGDTIHMRVRPNRSFHAPAESTDNRPMILIGNGTGLAGLRAHIKQRALRQQHSNWLIFGERNRAHDFLFQDALEAWEKQGVLTHLDLAFSRDQEQVCYVQHKLREHAQRLQDWIVQGAIIYVCGSMQGMAGDVDTALQEIIGEEKLEQMREAGEYKRDVY